MAKAFVQHIRHLVSHFARGPVSSLMKQRPGSTTDMGIIEMISHAHAPTQYFPADLPAAKIQQTDTAEKTWNWRHRGIFLGLLVLITLVWVVILGNLRTITPDSFVVVVADFTSSDQNATGQAVARTLTDELQQTSQRSDTNMVIRHVRQTPDTLEAALDLATRQQADVLVWGTIARGETLNAPSFSPYLIYTPGTFYGPDAWIGYSGRFRMPRIYQLANEPVNGHAVIPPLLTALAGYNQGDADLAMRQLTSIYDAYPALNTTLLHTLHGNVLWARGAYNQAADAYRCAQGNRPDDTLFCTPVQQVGVPDQELATLANNLGAILIDARDNRAERALLNAGTLLPVGQDFSEVRFNWGLLKQQQGDWNAAISFLDSARGQFANNPALLLALTDAYREAGDREAAETTLNNAWSAIRPAGQQVRLQQRDMFQHYLRAQVYEQRGLLHLAELLDAHGPLSWELEVSQPRPPEDFASAHQALNRAVTTGTSLVTLWQQRAVVPTPGILTTELVAAGQAERAVDHLNRQKYHLALIMIEQERTRARGTTTFTNQLGSFLFNQQLPKPESQEQVEALLATRPDNPALLIAYARALRLVTNYDEATVARLYERVIELTPDRPDGYYGLGWLAIGQERIDSPDARQRARQYMRAALEKHGAFYPARIKLAEIALYEGNLTTALEEYDQLISQRPYDPTMLVRLGDTLMRLDELEEAAAAYNQALHLNPEYPEALLGLARSYAAHGNREAAQQTVERALRLRSTYAEALLLKGELLIAQNDFPAANAAFQQAINAELQDVEILLTIGNLRLRYNEPQAAINAFKYALQVQPRDRGQPDDPRLHHGMAQAYLALGKYSQAVAHEQIALDIMNLIQSANQTLRASMLVTLGDAQRLQQYASPQERDVGYNRAEEQYAQALMLDPNQLGALLGQGQTDVLRGNWKMALYHFQEAYTLPDGDQNAAVSYWIAEALRHQPDLQPDPDNMAYTQVMAEVTTWYERALSQQPHFPQALLGLAYTRQALGETDVALQRVEQALQQHRNYAEAWLYKGNLLQQQGDTTAALQAYNQSLNANDQLAEAYYRRGRILIQQEQFDRALRDFQQAIRLQDNFPEARYWLGRSYFMQDQMTQALTAFQAAIDSQGGRYSEAEYYQGLAQARLGDYNAALASFQAVVSASDVEMLLVQARSQIEQIQTDIVQGTIPGVR